MVEIELQSKKKTFRKIANWLIRNKGYLPADVVIRMRDILKLDDPI